MKFYMVVNYYFVFKFHEDLCTNAHARVINARTRNKTCTRRFTTRPWAFMHKSKLLFRRYLQNDNVFL